jgi:hypothetical protein
VSLAALAPRRAITSRAKALEITEQIAAKHGLSVHQVVSARWCRQTAVATGELAWELRHKMGWSYRAIGEHLGRPHPSVRKLLSSHKMRLHLARRILPVDQAVAIAALDTDVRAQRLLAAEALAAHHESELRRLSGAAAPEVARALGLERKLRCAIVLCIVIEAYPRYVTGNDLVELYNEQCDVLGYGSRRGASLNLMTKNVQNLREHFIEAGWPEPIPSIERGSIEDAIGARRLTEKGARFLNKKLGIPRLSQLEAAKARSFRIPHRMAG